MRFFKYSPAEFDLLNAGTLRIGTLWDYRAKEHRRGIADSAEGTKSVVHAVGSRVFGGTPAGDFANALGVVTLEPGSSLEGMSLVVDERAEDMYLFCGSHFLSQETMASMDGADTVLEIIDPGRFFHQLDRLVSRKVAAKWRKNVDRVSYQTRSEKWGGVHSGYSAWLIKEPCFEPQQEWRTSWAPEHKGPLAPFCVDARSLQRWCKRVIVR